MKLLVTHFSPDLDAIAGIWMFKRFLARDYADAKLAFVDPGSTIDLRSAADMGFAPEEITHTDTGLGMFDHHQPDRGKMRICATSLVYDYICGLQPDKKEDKALAYISEYVTAIDHFEESSWPDANDPKYTLLIQSLIDGARASVLQDDEATVHFGMTCLDGAYEVLSNQFEAQDEITTAGRIFQTKWGKALAIESSNDEVVKFGQKQGFVIVVRKDKDRGNIRIKALPGKGVDLTPVADQILAKDTVGSWYLHPAKTMLLNGSSKMRESSASPLTLDEVIAIITGLEA